MQIVFKEEITHLQELLKLLNAYNASNEGKCNSLNDIRIFCNLNLTNLINLNENFINDLAINSADLIVLKQERKKISNLIIKLINPNSGDCVIKILKTNSLPKYIHELSSYL